jgi:hypothetical protein
MPPDDMEVIRESVTVVHLAELAESGFGSLVKAVVDVDKGIMVIGGEMHADEEAVLMGGRARPTCGGSISTRRNTARPIGSSSTR